MSLNALIVHRSVGWNKDSRIRKLAYTFSKKSINTHAFIWERANISLSVHPEKYLKYSCKQLLFSSKTYPRGSFLFSVIEIIQEILQLLLHFAFNKYNYIIVQNHRQVFHMILIYYFKFLFKRNCILIWDLRELPTCFNRNSLLVKFFRFSCQLPDYIWSMNLSRQKYIENIFKIKCDHFGVVSNFCERNYFNLEKHEIEPHLADFLSSSNYVHLQNPFNINRYGMNSIFSVLFSTDLKVVVSGKMSHIFIKEIFSLFGDNFIKKRCFFTGSVSEDILTSIIDNSLFSIILYNVSIPNNNFCDANRLYQSISRRIPVLVGNNEGLSSYVKKFPIGVVLAEDGRNIIDLSHGIQKILTKIKNNSFCFTEANKYLLWESNEEYIYQCLNRS